MKTRIIIKKGWVEIAKYDFPITLTKDDVVTFNDIEYSVDGCILDIDNREIVILLNE